MRILLVEDENSLGGGVRDHAAADGHAVDWVRHLDDAEASARAAAYDLMLLDLMLPDGSGLDFLRRLRAAGDVTPVIILTARDRISDRIAGLNAGADDYLVKPFDLSSYRREWRRSPDVISAIPIRWCSLGRRDDAYAWGVAEDTADPERIVEWFTVASWAAHLRQHKRDSRADADPQREVTALHAGHESPRVQHLMSLPAGR
jgi:CheY-like chemotaxis protein